MIRMNNDIKEILFIMDNWTELTNEQLLESYSEIKHLHNKISDDFDLFLGGLYDYSQNKIGYGVMSNYITVGWLEIREYMLTDK